MARPLTRIGLGLPIVIGAIGLAFGVGTYLGGKYLVPAGQGLAGPAEAMGYGLLAALAALVLAILAAVKLPLKTLGRAALGSIVIVIALLAALTLAMMNARAEPEGAAPNPPARQTTTPAVEMPCPPPETAPEQHEPPTCPDE